ncbi:hypothetical protein COCVIDRAFT_85071 [Bipolaris victoriae FI3]|uniref:Uncharacterized protein n=1 Tax=Bipolaris victoriae (strain FI3) TaxID=930091 RepID=W7F0A6_BIPV3|nr:hypothetical protein COCVIDRAFT_85071 [Bipolaris victoriae FI3]
MRRTGGHALMLNLASHPPTQPAAESRGCHPRGVWSHNTRTSPHSAASGRGLDLSAM